MFRTTIPAGDLLDTLFNTLMKIPMFSYAALKDAPDLEIFPSQIIYSEEDLCYEEIDAYCRLLNCSVAEIFHCQDQPPCTHSIDPVFFCLLDRLPKEKLQLLSGLLDARFRPVISGSTPGERLISLITARDFRRPSANDENKLIVMLRTKRFWAKSNIMQLLPSELLPAACAEFGCSMRWLLGFRSNWYCKTPAANDLADAYCLLTIQDKYRFLAMVNQVLETPVIELKERWEVV